MRIIPVTLSVIFAASVLFGVPAPGDTLLDSPTFDLCIDAPERENFPDAQTVMLFGEKTIALQSDGSYTITWRTVQKVLTFMGKKQLFNIKYRYNSDYEEIDITRARSITPTGDSTFVVLVADSLQINDITPPELANAGIYVNLQQRVVTMPGVTDSSIVDIAGIIRTTDKPSKPFGGIEFMAREAPVQLYTLTIIVPEGEKLLFESANGAPEPIIEGNHYIWTIEGYDGIVPESQSPLARDFFPCIYYTATRSWNLTADYIQRRFAPKTLTTDPIVEKADEIAGNLAGRAAIDTFTYWVARNISLIELDLGDAGYIPNNAATILRNGYADTRDRCVLLAALLKAHGFAPRFALLPPVDAVARDGVPTLAQFSRMVVTVDDPDGGRLWLWTEDDYTPTDKLPLYDGEKAFVVSQGRGELVEVPRVSPEEPENEKESEIDEKPESNEESKIDVE